MSRESFLERVRVAAAAGRQYRVHLPEIAPEAGYEGAGPDPLARFAQEIANVGGKCEIVQDLSAAREMLRGWLSALRPGSALCWEHPVLERLGLDGLLAELGITSLKHKDLAARTADDARKQMLAAGVGITSTTFAIGETGSLAVASGPGSERLASLLAPVHYAVVTADQIVPDLYDLFAHYQARGVETLPSNLTLITGPSKTGDIEMYLTTGVHGPGKWHVIVVRES